MARSIRRAIIFLSVLATIALLFVCTAGYHTYYDTIVSQTILNDDSSSFLQNHPSVQTAGNGSRILLVSAFFPLAKSKHSKEDYAYWLSCFLRPITTEIYFYTTPEFETTVRDARGIGLPIIINTIYTSPFGVPPLKGLEDKYATMHKIDREKYRHSPELYAIWNAKPFLLNEAVQSLIANGSNYDYVFWSDAGSFRGGHQYTVWPDVARVEQVWKQGSSLTGTNPEDLIFFPIFNPPRPSRRYWDKSMGPVDDEFSEGSFFGGSPTAVSWWSNTFYTYHDHYLSLGFFVGKDQTLINALFFIFPERIISVWPKDPQAPAHVGLIPYIDYGYLGSCGDEWYYYQFWLANERDREAMKSQWQNDIMFNRWVWWRNRQACRLTEVMLIKKMLQKLFGK